MEIEIESGKQTLDHLKAEDMSEAVDMVLNGVCSSVFIKIQILIFCLHF